MKLFVPLQTSTSVTIISDRKLNEGNRGSKFDYIEGVLMK